MSVWKRGGKSKESERAIKESKSSLSLCEGLTCFPSCFPKVMFSTIVEHMRLIQESCFLEERARPSKEEVLPVSSKLNKFTPFIDNEGLLLFG